MGVPLGWLSIFFRERGKDNELFLKLSRRKTIVMSSEVHDSHPPALLICCEITGSVQRPLDVLKH